MRSALADEMSGLKKTIKSLKIKLPKLEMEISGCDTTRVELTNSIPDLRAASVMSPEDKTKLESLKANVAKCQKDMKSTAALAEKLEAEVAKLQKSILDAGGEKLKKQQKSCDDVQKALKKANSELNAAKVDIATSTKNAAKAASEAELAEKELADEEVKVEESKAGSNALQEEATAAIKAYDAAKDASATKQKERDEGNEELETLKAAISKVKLAEVELTGKLENFEQQMKEHNGRLKFWRDEISKLRDAEEADAEWDLSDDEGEEEEEKGENESEGGDGEEEEEEEEGKKEEQEEMKAEGGEDVEGKGKAGTDADADANANADVDKDADATATEGTDKTDDDSEHKEVKAAKTLCHKIDPLPTLNEAALGQFDRNELKSEIEELEKERDVLGTTVNMTAISEYRKKEADYLEKAAELDKITNDRNEARKVWDEFRRLRLEMFMSGFGQITVKLKEMYQMITLGGDAELELGKLELPPL